MNRSTILPSQYWQDRRNGQVIECSGSFVPGGPEWGLAYRRIRLLRHKLSGMVTLEDATIENSALSDPNMREMTFAEYIEWKTVEENRDI